LSARHITFWDELKRGEKLPVRTVTLNSALPLSTLSAKYEPEMLTVNISPKETNPQHEFTITIQPTGRIPLGRFAFDVEISLISSSSESLPKAKLMVEGVIRDVIQASPDNIRFGDQPVGAIARANLTLQGESGIEWSVLSIVPSGDDVQVLPASTTTKERQVFTVHQQILLEGLQERQIKFHILMADHRQFEITVAISYYGVDKDSVGKAIRSEGRPQ
jgi:hypothetical protein